MKECIFCYDLIKEDQDYCRSCIMKNKRAEKETILRLKKQLPKTLSEYYLERYLLNIQLINQIEPIEVLN